MDEVKEIKEALATAENKPQSITKTETNLTFNDFSWLDAPNIKTLYSVANNICKSAIVPQNFRNDPFGVMIAMEMADRTKMGLMPVLQNLYIVQGKPSWSGQFCVAAVNGCGRFSPLEFKWFHDDSKNPNKVTGCVAQAKDIATGNLVTGAPVTEETVKGFGWDKKSGSMWNIPGQREQMYMYRAASYFARVHCPEVLQGLYTKEETMDINGVYTQPESKIVINMEENN